MNNTISLFPDEEMVEKFEQRREELGMSEEEYFAHLMELSDEYEHAENEAEEPEDEDEEQEEQDQKKEEQFSEILAGITDVSDKDSIIKELKHQVIAREEEISKLTDEINEMSNYPRFNLIFSLVKGHTLSVGTSKHKITIREKKDLIQCLVKNFHWNLDSEDFGVNHDDFEEMLQEAFKEEKGQ